MVNYFIHMYVFCDKCSICGNLSFFEEFVHESSLHDFGQILVDIQKFNNVEYGLKDGKIGKRIDLIIEKG